MSEKPLVSIIIPTYNRAHLIKETLDSVLAQTYHNWECIIVDDGSTDNTEDILEAYIKKDNRFKYYHRPEEHLPGGNGARNFGFKMSEGGFVIFFDSDDLMAKNCLSNRADFASKKVCDMYVFYTGVLTKKGFSSKIWNQIYKNEKKHQDVINRFIKNDMPWHTSGVLWRSSFIKELEVWNENLTILQDWELHIRALLLRPKILFANRISDTYYRVSHNDSKSKSKMNLEKIKAIEQAIFSVEGIRSLSPSLKRNFNFLIIHYLIKKHISNKSYWHIYKLIYQHKLYNRILLSSFIIEFFSTSYKIKKLCKVVFKNYFVKTELNSTHLKLHYEDVQGNFGDYMLL